MPSDLHERICDVVARIPSGRVATYGQIAKLAGLGGQARLVGYALYASDRPLPWHRVINARGEVSRRGDSYSELFQYQLLASEGVEFDGQGRISLRRFRWNGEAPPSAGESS
ncbi:MGMT family protein [Candidatus Palauibacter sp.]|uniref:MGMT family protein n=1 Tax=Candidatus Palauibacter sp. TaxID=3101350 RepID=UPI003B5CBAA1